MRYRDVNVEAIERLAKCFLSTGNPQVLDYICIFSSVVSARLRAS